jgi:hypothetical protein
MGRYRGRNKEWMKGGIEEEIDRGTEGVIDGGMEGGQR